MMVQLNKGEFKKTCSHKTPSLSILGTKILLAPAPLCLESYSLEELLCQSNCTITPKEKCTPRTWGMHSRYQQKQDYGYLKCHRQFQIQTMFCCLPTECYSGPKSILDAAHWFLTTFYQFKTASASHREMKRCLLALQYLVSLRQ